MIKFNQKERLKPYFYTNTKLRTKEKNNFFSSLWTIRFLVKQWEMLERIEILEL